MSTHTNESDQHTCFPANHPNRCNHAVQTIGGILNQFGISSETVCVVDDVVGLLGRVFDRNTSTDHNKPQPREVETRTVKRQDVETEEVAVIIEKMADEKMKTVAHALDDVINQPISDHRASPSPLLQSALERLKQAQSILTLADNYITDPENQMKVYRDTIANLCDELNRTL